MNTCSECGGIGDVQDMEVRQHGRYQMQWHPCPACDGTGTIEIVMASGMCSCRRFRVWGRCKHAALVAIRHGRREVIAAEHASGSAETSIPSMKENNGE